MEKYIKPSIISSSRTDGIIPAVAAVAGLSATQAFAVGAAAGLGVKMLGPRNIDMGKLRSLELQEA
ncbi:hypothetical protein I3700191H1_05350 [Megasphaera massiliensis]|uniref:hypothetical protein n=1 Tax=Megasphaera massiliensis TaxID=1232428 RepID=UPI0034BB1122